MFRIILIFLIFFYFPSKGQDYFFAEGKKVKLQYLSKTFNYHYLIKNGTIELELIDSIITKQNSNKTITLLNNCPNDTFIPKTSEIIYSRMDGQDSIHLYLKDSTLYRLCENKYDSIGRVVRESTKYFEYSCYTETNRFVYKDSITKAGKITSKTAFSKIDSSSEQFYYACQIFYNNNSEKTKLLFISPNRDTSILDTLGNDIGTNFCTRKLKIKSSSFKLNNKKLIVLKYLTKNINLLLSPKCNQLEYEYYNPEKSIFITIKKLKADIEPNVIITIIEQKGSS